MEACLQHVSTIATFLHCQYKLKKRKSNCRVAAKFSNDDDPFLQSALHSATLRFQETHRPDPLFHDPYFTCLVPANTSVYMKQHSHPYCLSTRFIDDKLLQTLRNGNELKQTNLAKLYVDMTYHQIESTMKCRRSLEISRSCLLLHVSLESSNIQEVLRKKGYNGNRPSIWALQGLPLMTLASFEDVLSVVSSLATKRSLVIGEVPTELDLKTDQEEWMHKLFMRHGFQIHVIDYEDLARSFGRDLSRESYSGILFVAEHLRFSDDQMDMWRSEFQRTEEEGDEEGFEDL